MTGDLQQTRPSVEPVDEVSSETREKMKSLGIVAHEHTTYEWNGYRYSNAKDAIAAAKRGAR